MAYQGIKGAVNGMRNMLEDMETIADRMWEQHEEDRKNKKEAYQEGLSDAWEAARTIVVNPGAGGLSFDELDEIFGTQDIDTIFRENLASEAIEKIKAYEDRERDICVGDEIVTDDPLDGSDKFGVVVEGLDGKNRYKILLEDFTFWFPDTQYKNFRKTGRHIPVDRLFEGSR